VETASDDWPDDLDNTERELWLRDTLTPAIEAAEDTPLWPNRDGVIVFDHTPAAEPENNRPTPYADRTAFSGVDETFTDAALEVIRVRVQVAELVGVLGVPSIPRRDELAFEDSDNRTSIGRLTGNADAVFADLRPSGYEDGVWSRAKESMRVVDAWGQCRRLIGASKFRRPREIVPVTSVTTNPDGALGRPLTAQEMAEALFVFRQLGARRVVLQIDADEIDDVNAAGNLAQIIRAASGY
ncbi:MAG: hypothetical protein AAFP26_13575, partial [Planctomycetota bacterium]